MATDVSARPIAALLVAFLAVGVVKFSFMTPAHGGVFRWQCFIPCGGGFLDGNGGPMQTMGYMTGNMTVVS